MEIKQIGRDPFLVAYALNNERRCIVTKEVSAPAKTRANKKVPDVCNDLRLECNLRLECIDAFEFNRRLNFSTDWESKVKV